jgi:hypothetical protein
MAAPQTFGDTTQGTKTLAISAVYAYARKFTGFPGGNVSSLSLCCQYQSRVGDSKWKAAIYAADGASGTPGTLLWASKEFTMAAGMSSLAFRTVNKAGGGSTYLDEQDLWIAFFTDNSIFASDDTSGGTGIRAPAGYSYSTAPVATWNYGTTAYNRLWRVYLTYEPPSAGLYIPSLMGPKYYPSFGGVSYG